MTRIEIVTIATPSLGDRSYLATDGQHALVVDPQRDIDRVLAAAATRGVTISHVFETHIHNDYLTGGLALARATGAAYHVNAADQVAFDRAGVTDGDLVPVGGMLVRVMATPGHTHGFGSFCAAGPASAGADGSTIAGERQRNPALTQDQDSGPAPAGLVPPAAVSAAGLSRRIRAGTGSRTCATGVSSRPVTCPGRSASSTVTTWWPTSAGSCRRAPH